MICTIDILYSKLPFGTSSDSSEFQIAFLLTREKDVEAAIKIGRNDHEASYTAFDPKIFGFIFRIIFNWSRTKIQ